jgi:beta-galactosidase
VQFKTRGAIALVGPQAVSAEGGLCGCYVRTMGRAGRGSLSITAEGLEPVTLAFTVSY